jgi:putative heme-binding domain-containing protein
MVLTRGSLSGSCRPLRAVARWLVPSAVLLLGFIGRQVIAAQVGGLADRLAGEDRQTLAAACVNAGDPARGARVFHVAQLACITCHSTGAGPVALGPDLARMPADINAEQLPAYLVEALLDPSATIRAEYRGMTIVNDEGQSLTGIVVRETPEEVVLRDAAAAGRELSIPRGSIEASIPATVSLMPAGLVNLLADREQFLDLVAYLVDIAQGGPSRAAELRPDPTFFAAAVPAAWENDIDHAAFVGDWADPSISRAALKRGGDIYARVCANCHGTLDAPGSLPTAPRFAQARLKAGSDPYSLYRTLTSGTGQMVAQTWMVPSQKYDVIHYLRETFFRDRNPSLYAEVSPDYLAGLPRGTSRGPEPASLETWRLHDYGPFLAGSFEVGSDGSNVARKGLSVRLDAGPGGVSRGQAWILHELDTLRAAALWTGSGFIDWAGINFDGRHGAHPRLAGDVIVQLATQPGWADPVTGSFADSRPLGRDGLPYGPLPYARFHALHHAGDQVVLEYRVGNTRVLESASMPQRSAAVGTAGAPVTSPAVVIRSFSFGPRPQPLAARLAMLPATARIVGAQHETPSPQLVERDGCIDLLVPAGDLPLDVHVAFASAEAPVDPLVSLLTPPSPSSLIGRPAQSLWATPLSTQMAKGDESGPLAIDVLTAPNQNPWNAQLRFSGLDFLNATGDTAVLCTWDGDVWRVEGLTAADGRLTWRRIASGLYQPLGIKVIEGVIHVGCRDRIVRLIDLDGDGQTDRYDTFNDDHQVTEHFHEFAMGLETDAEGNVYYAKSARHALPAVVPHHGTLLKVNRDGSGTEIVAQGFRAANGVCVESDGTFWVTDQEGHWNPKNRINHVRPGGFYGNMLGFHGVTDASDAAMEPPAVWITNAFDRSPAELLRVPLGRFEPLAGHLLELSYGEGRIHLVLTEPVTDPRGLGGRVLQGALVPLPMDDLPTGIMRGRFGPVDGHLYTCGLHAWAGNRTAPGGFFRVRRTPHPLRLPLSLHAAAGILELTFSTPLAAGAENPASWQLRTWEIDRTQEYGSPHRDEQSRAIQSAALSADGRSITLTVPGFAAARCYALSWQLPAADGSVVEGSLNGTLH